MTTAKVRPLGDPKLRDEDARLAALYRYEVLDTEPEEPFDKITSLVKAVLGVPICTISLIDRERQWLKSVQGMEGRNTPRSVSFCTRTIQSRRPMIISDTLSHEAFRDSPLVLGPPYIRSYAGAPLQTPDGYNLGALCAIDTRPRAFDEGQIALLEDFSALVVDQLELRRIAERDFLTGGLTRRGFLGEIDKEIARFSRHGRASALVTFDIDHFKAVNDRYGHPVGDVVLKAVALCCEQLIRPSDSFGRLGGEEFAVLMSETTASEALLGAERLRAALTALRFDGHPGLTVSASFGVASITRPRCDPDLWLADADAALYAAKRQGRDRVCSADDILAIRRRSAS